MARYIDAEKAIKAVEDMRDCYNGFSDSYDKAAIVGLLEEVPTADVAPVVHAHWLPRCGENWESYICSNCGQYEPCKLVCETNPDEQGRLVMTQVYDCRYCPYCGAETGEE